LAVPKTIKAIDLFSGAGGFSCGLSKAGVEILFAADNWDKAVESYARNFDHPVLNVDLSAKSYAELCKLAKVEAGRVDLVVGGPPCQGFSVQRIGKDEDARNNLVLEYARLVVEAHPRLFLMENVLGLVGARGKELLKAFLERMAKAGYSTTITRVNACDYGVPQQRRRTIIAGWLPDKCAPFVMPAPTHPTKDWVTVRQAIAGLNPPPSGENKQDPLHKQSRMSALNL
jgi:DNA (cytosine-5)-methyltransferase 1